MTILLADAGYTVVKAADGTEIRTPTEANPNDPHEVRASQELEYCLYSYIRARIDSGLIVNVVCDNDFVSSRKASTRVSFGSAPQPKKAANSSSATEPSRMGDWISTRTSRIILITRTH